MGGSVFVQVLIALLSAGTLGGIIQLIFMFGRVYQRIDNIETRLGSIEHRLETLEGRPYPGSPPR